MGDPSLFAVFGHPIEHSLSPVIHNIGFAARHMSSYYFPIDCTPPQLADKLEAFRLIGGRGVNLTRPLKEDVLHWVGVGDDWVAEAGAANTLVAQDTEWKSANTDCQALFALLTSVGLSSSGTALILGSGGAARASAAVLRRFGCRVVAAVRTPRACDWADQVILWDERLEPRPWRVVVNATPIGQTGEGQESRWPMPIAKGLAVDWVYRPNQTAFLTAARHHGAYVLDGLSLLVEQAALAWSVWFGEDGPREVMREAVAQWR